MTFKEYDFLIMGTSFSGNYQILGAGPPGPSELTSQQRCVFFRKDAHCYNNSNESEIELIVDI